MTRTPCKVCTDASCDDPCSLHWQDIWNRPWSCWRGSHIDGEAAAPSPCVWSLLCLVVSPPASRQPCHVLASFFLSPTGVCSLPPGNYNVTLGDWSFFSLPMRDQGREQSGQLPVRVPLSCVSVMRRGRGEESLQLLTGSVSLGACQCLSAACLGFYGNEYCTCALLALGGC